MTGTQLFLGALLVLVVLGLVAWWLFLRPRRQGMFEDGRSDRRESREYDYYEDADAGEPDEVEDTAPAEIEAGETYEVEPSTRTAEPSAPSEKRGGGLSGRAREEPEALAPKPKPTPRRRPPVPRRRWRGRGSTRPPEVARYANVTLFEQGKRLEGGLPVGTPVEVRIGIGPLDPQSHVRAPGVFPDKLLPKRDISLTVVLSSSDLKVGMQPEGLDSATATAMLVLPHDGGPARTLDGERHLSFFAVAEYAGTVQARITYFYRGVVVQSQRLVGSAGFERDEVSVVTDYTLSTALGDELDTIPERNRIAILANEAPDGRHEFLIRGAGANGAVFAQELVALDAGPFSAKVAALRSTLAKNAPTTRQLQRRHLERDLRETAPLGWSLYASLMESIQGAMTDLSQSVDGDVVVHIGLPKGKTFTVPWSLLYDIYLDEQIPIGDLPFCRSVSEDGALHQAAQAGARRCPWDGDPDHAENILCPFGFWGFRYQIEQLVSTDKPESVISLAPGTHIAVGRTQANVDEKRLSAHLERIRGSFSAIAPEVKLIDVASKKKLRTLCEVDLPLLYFLCHGDRAKDATYLTIGKRDRITPQDFAGWVQTKWRREQKIIWNSPRPLVFINACESVAIQPSDLVSYAGTLVGTAHAAGLIGTEVKVHQVLAMEAAELFFAGLLQPGGTVGEALRRGRLTFLADRNLFGLVYTSFCMADVAFAPA